MPILEGAPTKFFEYLVISMVPLTFSPEDILIYQGSLNSRLYFILKGEAEVFNFTK